MKRMWSEEEVNAAIAEYAATHPAGGKLYLHNITFKARDVLEDAEIANVKFAFVSGSNVPMTKQTMPRDTPIALYGTYASYYGAQEGYALTGMIEGDVFRIQGTFDTPGGGIGPYGFSLIDSASTSTTISDTVSEL